MSLPAATPEVKAEALGATWQKRYFQNHYTYRDSHTAATAAAAATYVFGVNARAISRWNWPASTDPWIIGPPVKQCLARDVAVFCDQDCFIRFTCLNPPYLGLSSLGYSTAQLLALGVPQYIVEVEHFIPANTMVTFYPTYAYSIAFRQSTAAGTIRISAEGNVEGGE